MDDADANHPPRRNTARPMRAYVRMGKSSKGEDYEGWSLLVKE
jgi:hypothetical protein